MGKRFLSRFGEDGSKSVEFLDNNVELNKRARDNQWIRWDGVEASAQEHGKWVLEKLRSLTSPEEHGKFRHYGSKKGCKYYIHDEESKKAGGYGLFKIEANLKLEPRDLLAFVFDMEQMKEHDSTIVLYKVVAKYLGEKEGDPFALAVYWSNNPGFPFQHRDGIDLTTYSTDDDGTMWQMSVSLTGGDYFRSQKGGFEATDRIFGYKLMPQEDGTTNVTLICQTVLGGYIPVFLSNYFVCGVLIDYMKTADASIHARKGTGEHQKLLNRLELD